jgi:hypothetical protein
MGTSNFPGGVTSYGVPVLPSNSGVFTGTAFFVCNRTGANGSDGNIGTRADQPLATLAKALTLVTANNDDVIYVMSGHAETLATAAAIAVATAGVNIVGLGVGNRRPTFTWATSTAATWTITAANVLIKNILCTSTIAALVKLFSVTAAGVTFDAVDYVEDGSTDALQFVLTTAAATDMTIQNCHWYRGTTAASALSQWIVLTGADRAKILNNYLLLKGFATANPINSAVAVVTTAAKGIQIASNSFYDSNSTGNVSILTIANTTGVISDNYVGTSKTATPGSVVPSSCFAFQNFCVNEVAKSGFLDPAADTT